MDENRRQIAAELARIEAATRDMIYPLRTDALAILREAAKRIEHLNELASRRTAPLRRFNGELGDAEG